MDSTKLYQQSGIGVLGLDSLTCSVSRVDLCHQITDHEESEEDEENYEQIFVHFTFQKLLLTTTHCAYHYDASKGDNDL